MARPPSKHPTNLELEILKILWRDGPQTVRQVREALPPRHELAHTSVITIMNIMEKKNYLTRKKSGGHYVYRPRIRQQTTTQRMMRDLIQRAFDGSASAAMVNVLDDADLSRDQLKELRQLIERKAKEKQQ